MALSEQSGVARSTIAKYLAKAASGSEVANPDLKLLCRIANHLNVPPALLLMRKEDWQRLAHAMGYLLPIWQNPKVQQAAREINGVELAPAQQAMAGENIAKQLNLHAPAMSRETFANSSLEDAVNYRNMRALLGLRTTCALPPLETMSEEYHFALLYICASVGANPT